MIATPPITPPDRHEELLFATDREPGAVHLAADGTLLLRAFDDLAPSLQRRVLATPMPCRIVATTWSSVDHAFQADVLRTFGGIVEVVPLRARFHDLDDLAAWIWNRHNARAGTELPLPDDLLPQIFAQSRSFPGNVRQLENALERAFVFLQAGDLETYAALRWD